MGEYEKTKASELTGRSAVGGGIPLETATAPDTISDSAGMGYDNDEKDDKMRSSGDRAEELDADLLVLPAILIIIALMTKLEEAER